MFCIFLSLLAKSQDDQIMLRSPYNYSIFFDFIESYLPSGFLEIGADDPIMLRLQEVMEENDQFFTISDLGKIQFLYATAIKPA